MANLIITRFDEVVRTLEERAVAAVLSIEHPGAVEAGKGAPRLEQVPQLILSFWDSEQEVERGPDLAQVEAGIAFVLEHVQTGDVLIHCHAGKSRSVAIALGVLALQNPDMGEKELVEKLLAIRPIAAPNIIVVEMVDKLAGRDGKLLQAVQDHPVITEQRRIAEENRQWLIENRPELMKAMFPEKKFKP